MFCKPGYPLVDLQTRGDSVLCRANSARRIRSVFRVCFGRA